MWALRRASIPLKNPGFTIGASRVFSVKSERVRHFKYYNAGFSEPQGLVFDGLLSSTRFYNTSSDTPKLYMEIRNFSSQANSKSRGEEDDNLEDGFSELEAPNAVDAIQEANAGDENDDELISEPELPEEEDTDDDIGGVRDELEVLDTEIEVEEKGSSKIRSTSALAEAILAAPMFSLNKVLDKWVEEGNEVTRTEVLSVMLNLRRRHLYTKALQT